MATLAPYFVNPPPPRSPERITRHLITVNHPAHNSPTLRSALCLWRVRDPRPPLGAYTRILFGVDLTRQISVHTGKFSKEGISLADRPGGADRLSHENRMNLLVSSAQSDLGGARRSATSRSLRAFSSAAMPNAGLGERSRASGRFAELTLGSRRLSSNRLGTYSLGVSCVYRTCAF